MTRHESTIGPQGEESRSRLAPEVLVTAEEAYPAFEREMLRAQSSILLGFRIFEPRTKLTSEEGRAIGETWADLIAHTLARGVSIDFTLTDFDPVTRPVMHRRSWYSLAEMQEAADRSGRPDLFSGRVSMHPARVGILPRIFLWPLALREIRRHVRHLNERGENDRQTALDHMPGFRDLVVERDGKLQAKVWPIPPLCPVSHHQKVAVFDERVLYIGGLDLNERRRDTKSHDQPADQTWHDVQVIVRGPIAASAAAHLRNFRKVTFGEPPMPLPGLMRTLSTRRRWNVPFQSPRRCVTELADVHYRLVTKAERLIYLETQFFRDRRLASLLARRAREVPDLGLVLILPAAPEDVAFQNHRGMDSRYGEYLQATCLDRIRSAFGRRVFVGAPAQPRPSTSPARDAHYHAPIIYLHSKVSVFDDSAAVVSSANLNGRSFRWDTEAGVLFEHRSDVDVVKDKVMAHWLPEEGRGAFFDPATAVERWRSLATSNAAKSPQQRHSFLLPYREEPARRLGRNLPGVPEEMV